LGKPEFKCEATAGPAIAEVRRKDSEGEVIPSTIIPRFHDEIFTYFLQKGLTGGVNSSKSP
jgi:hypothetical protein